jgi:two-component system chemotaxis response regulator CheB
MQPHAAIPAPCDLVSHKMCRIVAMGASAGGLHSLTEILAGLPESLPCCIVVATHLSDSHVSILPELLARKSSIRVVPACNGVLQPSTVYVAPPGLHVTIAKDRIHMVDSPRVHFLRPSINMLFESLAAAAGTRAVAVVLSGTGNDGAEGISMVKAAGGYTIIEDPEHAEFRDMPLAAHRTGCVDSVLPLAKISEKLVELCGAYRLHD